MAIPESMERADNMILGIAQSGEGWGLDGLRAVSHVLHSRMTSRIQRSEIEDTVWLCTFANDY